MLTAPTIQFSITDTELQRRSQCSLYTPTVFNPLEGPAERAFRWAIKQREAGKIASPADLREYFMREWNKDWDERERNTEYWVGPKKAPAFARRVYEFLLKYVVTQAFQPYTLQLDRGQVTGEYALALWSKYRSEPVPMVIHGLLTRPRKTLLPDYKVLAQWLAARQDVEDVDLGIAHLPWVSGDFWTTKDVDELRARGWLNAIVSQAADRADFPHPGTQCRTCSQPCTEVFRGPGRFQWD